MPLPTNLTTNEVKDRAGTEVEFLFREEVGRSREYQKSGETPSLPERIKVQHQETGKNISLVRRSNLRVTKTVMSQVDSVTPVQIIFSGTLQVPQGHLNDLNATKDVMSYVNSILGTTGAGTTVLFDGTGTAATALINGTL